MEESTEILSQYLPDIHQRLEAIDTKLGDQFESVDGLTPTLRLIHGLVATMQYQWDGKISAISTPAWIGAIAIVVHVVHHW